MKLRTRQALYIQRNTEARACNHCCSGKAICITYSERVSVALGIHMPLACAILPSATCPALQYFSALSHKRHDFRGKKRVVGRKMCVVIFSTTFV